jgi:hypothetical protein
MRPTPEHEALAVKIAQTWPRSAPVDVWAEDISDLHIGACNTAFVRQRRELTHAPTIADFRRAVMALTMTDAGTRPADCPKCDNTGWLQTDDLILHPGTDHERRNTQTEPCNCTEGRRRSESAIWRDRTRAA